MIDLNNPTHLDQVFEHYWLQGATRDLGVTAGHFGVSFEQLQQVAEMHGFEALIETRIQELSRAFYEQYRIQTAQQRNQVVEIIGASITQFQTISRGVPLLIESVDDLAKIALALERLSRASALPAGMSEAQQPTDWASVLESATTEGS